LTKKPAALDEKSNTQQRSASATRRSRAAQRLLKPHDWHRKLANAIAPRVQIRAVRIHHPSVTVIRPVRGKDVGAAENFKAALDTGYPGEVETIFVFDDENDPAGVVRVAPVAAGSRVLRGADRDAGRDRHRSLPRSGMPAAGLVAQSASLLVLQRRYGGAPIPAKWAVMPMAFFLVAPYVLVKNMLKNRVEWRGREYKVDTSTAALAAPVSQPSKPVPVLPIRRAA
jgi:hypothetical protein